MTYKGTGISRRSKTQTDVDIATSIGSSTAIHFGPYAEMLVQVTSGTISTVTVYACDTEDGTYVPVKDDAGSDLTISLVSSHWVRLNLNAFAAEYVKFVDGSNALECSVMLKA